MKFVIWDQSVVDRDGDRILLDGMNLDNYRKNPVMFFNHSRSWGDESKVIGRFENLRIEGSQLFGEPVFDMNDEEAAEIARKVEEKFLHACSIGFRTITADDSLPYLPNQRRATITQSELLEISIVEIPAHQNAVRQKSYNLNEKKKAMTLEEIEAKLKELQKIGDDVKTANAEIDTLKKENAELKTKIEATEKKLAEAPAAPSIADFVKAFKNETATSTGEDRYTWTVFDWKSKDSEGLKNLETENPTLYQSILKKLK